MEFQTSLSLLLVLHITGLAMMAGAVVADISLSTRSNKILLTDQGRALTLLEGAAGLVPFIGAGALLLILSGTIMVVQLKSAVTQMLWFRVKMPLVILLVLNGVAVGRPLTMRLRKLLSPNGGRADLNLVRPIRTRLKVVYVVQILLFLTIFVLSVFKF